MKVGLDLVTVVLEGGVQFHTIVSLYPLNLAMSRRKFGSLRYARNQKMSLIHLGHSKRGPEELVMRQLDGSTAKYSEFSGVDPSPDLSQSPCTQSILETEGFLCPPLGSTPSLWTTPPANLTLPSITTKCFARVSLSQHIAQLGNLKIRIQIQKPAVQLIECIRNS